MPAISRNGTAKRVADGLRTAGRRSRRRAHVRDKKMPKHERPPTRVGCDSLDLDFHLGVPPVRFHNTLPRVSVSPITQHHD